MTTLSGKVSSLTVRSVSVPLPSSFAAGDTYNTNLKTIIDADLPSGYKCLCIAGWDASGAKIVLSQLRYYNSSYSFQAWNASTSAYTDRTTTVLYLAIKS